MLTRHQVLQQQLDDPATDIQALLADEKVVKRLRDQYSLLELVARCHPNHLAPVLARAYPTAADTKANPYTLWQVDKTLQESKRTPVSNLAASHLIHLCFSHPGAFYTPEGPDSLSVFDRVRKTISFVDKGTVSFHRGPPVQKEGEDFSVKPYLPWFSPLCECYLDYYLRFRGESVLVVPREATAVFFAKPDQAPEVWLVHQWHIYRLSQLEDLDVIRAAKAEIRPVHDQDGVLKASAAVLSVPSPSPVKKEGGPEEMEKYLRDHKIRFTRLV